MIMRVMGFETSCDETAVSLIERGSDNRILAEEIKSQIPLHAKFGGVVPEIASRTHYETIDFLTERVLATCQLKMSDINLLAFTRGPGLIGSLLVGLSFVKALSYANSIPFIPVDHIEAHIESAFLPDKKIDYPLVALVVSGGHSCLYYQASKFKTQLLSRTRDDAVGEVMDKIAKHFGLGYPGGPLLDKIYPLGDADRYSFTVPRMSDGSDDFSFSGYKTAVLRYSYKDNIQANDKNFYDLIASFLYAVVDYLYEKTLKAAERYNVRSVIVAGGVSRNSLLRDRFSQFLRGKGIALYLPDPQYCTDNAAMVAWLGYEGFQSFPGLNYLDYSINSYSRALFKESVKNHLY